MAGVAYLDSSALVKLVAAELESWALGDYVRDHPVVSSELARVELPRAVRRLGLDGAAVTLAGQVLRRITLLKLERTILARAAELEPVDLRSLDAIHLASALSVPELEAFVTYDRRLATASEEAGIPVMSPA